MCGKRQEKQAVKHNLKKKKKNQKKTHNNF